MSVFSIAQVPPEHCIVPVGHAFEQVPLAQTCVPVHVWPHEPQLLVSWDTQALLQLRSPLPQAQVPLWQVEPVPHTWPQAPQFWESLPMTLMHWPLQLICPVGQPPPVAGVAQLATKRTQPRQATSADKRVLRASMVRLLLGGASKAGFQAIGWHPTSPRGGDRQLPIARLSLDFLEVPPGFEPGNEGFADPCLTTWPRHRS